jgi:tRNA pseudouridine38-40 synthase
MSSVVRTWKLVVEYDGSNLCGWQRQDNGPTVQGHLETALADLLGRTTAVAGASRTDAGVHALGQVARFCTDINIPARGIVQALNARLPAQIAIASAEQVHDDWHPRFSATGKHYRYVVWTRDERSAIGYRQAWHRQPPRGTPLDVERMQQAARHFHGVHDYSAFRAVGCAAKTTVRRIDEVVVSIDVHSPHSIVIDVKGNAFLRNMVRIMAGTLIDVAEGRIEPAQLPAILASCDRSRAGQTAPAQGLTLMSVRYDGLRGEQRAASGATGNC